MNLREQEYITAIAKYGSITKAAEALHIAQPTLSIFLRKLEQSMGTLLFERSNKQYTPTYAGELYLACAQEMLYRYQQFQNDISEINAGHQGRIRVGLHKKRTLYLLPAVLMRMQERYPNVEVTIFEGDSLGMERLLKDNELDLVVCNRYFSSEIFHITKIAQDDLLCVTKKDHPASVHAVPVPDEPYPYINLNHFAQERFILQLPDQTTRFVTDQALAYDNVTPQRTFLIENMETASQLAAEGYGIAFTVKSYAPLFVYTKPVDYYLIGNRNTHIDIFIARNKFAPLPSYSEYFIELIKEYIAYTQMLPKTALLHNPFE